MKLQISANSLRNVYPDLWEASCLTLQSRPIPADDPILKLVCKMMYVDHCLINTRRLEFTAHTCSISGVPQTGTRAFGSVSVMGLRRVPRLAANIIAFI